MDVPQGRGMTTPEEVKSLRDTIATLRQRIADLEAAQTLGAADHVILQAMDGREMTLIGPKGARMPSGFPSGDLLCEHLDGSRVYSYDPYKVLAWLAVNGLAEVRGER